MFDKIHSKIDILSKRTRTVYVAERQYFSGSLPVSQVPFRYVYFHAINGKYDDSVLFITYFLLTEYNTHLSSSYSSKAVLQFGRRFDTNDGFLLKRKKMTEALVAQFPCRSSKFRRILKTG